MIIPAKVLPADIKPNPVWASGMMKLRKDFAGLFALRVTRPSTGQMKDINYLPNGRLDEAALDSFRAGEYVRVDNRAEQMGNYTLDSTTFDRRPKLGGLTLGNHRCIWMEGDGQIDNDPPAGQVFGMETVATPITPLNIRGNSFTVMQVLQHHSAVYFNNAGGVGAGTMFAMKSSVGPIHRLYNDGAGDASTFGGTYRVIDGASLNYYTRNGGVVETGPIILTCICGPGGVFIGQNEDFRSTAQAPTNAAVAEKIYVGYHDQSVNGGANESGGFSELLTMVWNQPLTLNQAAAFRNALYDLVQINHLHSHPQAPLVLTLTDSVWAGYKGDDMRSWDKRAAPNLSSRIRWVNFAMPGAPVMSNGGPVVGYTLGMYPAWISPVVRTHKGKVHCVWGCPLNDYNLVPRPTPSQFYTNGLLQLMSLIRGTDPSATFTICTSSDSSNPVAQDWRHEIDVLIRDGAVGNGYGVVDFAVDPFLSDWHLATKDGTHPNNAGFARMGELIAPRIQAWEAALN